MSNMIDETRSVDHRVSEAKPTELSIDIVIVFAVSGLAFFLEDLANARGWISVGAEARGVTAVLGGALAAVGVVFARGGTLADLGFRRPKRWATVPLQVIGILVAFIAVQNLAPLLVSSFISLPEPDLSRHDSISGNLGAAITMALVLPLTASIGAVARFDPGASRAAFPTPRSRHHGVGLRPAELGHAVEDVTSDRGLSPLRVAVPRLQAASEH